MDGGSQMMFTRFGIEHSKHSPAGLALHVIVDNCGTHNHPRVKSRPRRHPRFHLHFIPKSRSWLNMVTRWLREITDKRFRLRSFKSVPELIATLKAYIDNHNQSPQAFVWTAPAAQILS